MLIKNPFHYRVDLSEGFPTKLTVDYTPELVELVHKHAEAFGNDWHLGLFNDYARRCHRDSDDPLPPVQVEVNAGRLVAIDTPGTRIAFGDLGYEVDIADVGQLATSYAVIMKITEAVVASKPLPEDDYFAILNWPNFIFSYHPTGGMHGHPVGLKLGRPFKKFAKGQQIDEEEYSQKGLKVLEAIFAGWESVRHYRRTIFHFPEGGLMKSIMVPGDATSLDDMRMGYGTHNCDSPLQSTALITLANLWLNDLEARIQ